MRDDREQVVLLVQGQHGGRLVEDQDPGVDRQRAGDLDQLLLRRRERSVDRRVGLEREVVALQELARRARMEPLAVDHAEPARGSRPRKMFSATERCGIRLSSW